MADGLEMASILLILLGVTLKTVILVQWVHFWESINMLLKQK